MDINMNNKDRFNELLFENRNKNYGAYVIRKNYDRRLMLSSLISLSFIVFAMFAPKFFSGVNELVNTSNKVKDKVKITQMNLIPVVHPPTQSSGRHNKGSKSSTPVPTDTNKVAENDTNKTIHITGNIGDPRGTDTTDVGVTGNGGTNTIAVVKQKQQPTSFPDVNPEFPGGMEALAKFIRDHMHYPRVALEDGIKGTIYLSFVVDEDGKVTEIKNLNKLGGGLETEAVRVASLMPDWKPGMLGGEKISVRYNLPVKFTTH